MKKLTIELAQPKGMPANLPENQRKASVAGKA